MSRYPIFICILIVLCCGAMAATASKMNESPTQASKSSLPSKGTVLSDPGEQVFVNNCGRCHMPPMSIAPRITGTVIMHMRVRARLSREDEELLLKYLAP
jgi:cytochrome c5